MKFSKSECIPLNKIPKKIAGYLDIWILSIILQRKNGYQTIKFGDF